jgi:hypothetical protein
VARNSRAQHCCNGILLGLDSRACIWPWQSIDDTVCHLTHASELVGHGMRNPQVIRWMLVCPAVATGLLICAIRSDGAGKPQQRP